jgi:hypothetical protein
VRDRPTRSKWQHTRTKGIKMNISNETIGCFLGILGYISMIVYMNIMSKRIEATEKFCIKTSLILEEALGIIAKFTTNNHQKNP